MLIKNKLILYSIFLLASFMIMVILGYLLVFPQVIRCYAIDLANFSKHKNHIYISADTNPVEADTLFSLLKAARQRLSVFWGKGQSEYTIIYCHSDELYRKYGSVNGSPANYFGTPFGIYVVIGPQGLNIDVISHEMCHAELTRRIGWLTMAREIPQWFNEGVALMVDYRYPGAGMDNTYQNYQRKWKQASLQGQINIPLQDLQEVEMFYKGDMLWVNLAYLRSGLEVSRWLAKVKQQGLLQLVQALQNDASFNETYTQVEKNGENSNK